MKQTITLCTCGKAPAYQDGLCVGCYSVRTTERLLRKQELGECKNCGRIGVKAKGRCSTCYEYRRRNGQDKGKVTRGKHHFCKICGNPNLHAWGRCAPCDTYWRRNDRERPQRLLEMYKERASRPRTIGVCTNCGRKADRNRIECHPCRLYRWKYGVARPERLWKAATLEART